MQDPVLIKLTAHLLPTMVQGLESKALPVPGKKACKHSNSPSLFYCLLSLCLCLFQTFSILRQVLAKLPRLALSSQAQAGSEILLPPPPR